MKGIVSIDLLKTLKVKLVRVKEKHDEMDRFSSLVM
jgi:hypothetical protein